MNQCVSLSLRHRLWRTSVSPSVCVTGSGEPERLPQSASPALENQSVSLSLRPRLWGTSASPSVCVTDSGERRGGELVVSVHSSPLCALPGARYFRDIFPTCETLNESTVFMTNYQPWSSFAWGIYSRFLLTQYIHRAKAKGTWYPQYWVWGFFPST